MTIPNILTTIRFLLVPVFPIVYFSGMENAHFTALCIFVFAMLLDVADGFIARKFNMITALGKMLDPAADKCMVITVVATLVATGNLSGWFLYFVLVKELVMIFSGSFIYKKEKIIIPSNFFGKLAAFLTFLLLVDAMCLGKFIDIFSVVVVISMACAFITYCISFVTVKANQVSQNTNSNKNTGV
ncbi:CDP-alcohol phosphatidyltransferase family protein [Qingrenia yutianensis]|uniref:Phosphatidylglycerophosphate synthase n=1 Tax=Qingrenia yutianensis TaxID=2763676 RepID=A0A926F6C5_9FIRM|nr:CDP-alcohol phosphatidyltransferase family protein [Qingrenia yutianensis]MBC8595541.1 CDP-alcohol phosphatidyltransferase family protein [Qingrenia yutianensis]